MIKRFLFLVLFLLTLFPLLGIGDGSIVKAQHWTYEDGAYWLPDVDANSNNEKCETCGHYYDPEEGHECRFKCEYCGEEVKDLNQHYEKSQQCANAAGYNKEEVSHCPFCYRVLQEGEHCDCANIVVPGTRPSEGATGNGGSSETGGSFSNSGYWYPDNNNVDIKPPYNPTHQKIDGEHLFKENLPAQSMKQETNMTCVPTAMANLLSHIGSQQTPEEMRQTIENTYNSIYAKEYGSIRKSGVNIDVIDDFMGTMNYIETSLSEVVSNLKNGIPCIGVIETDEGFLHMVEIVGYFDNNNYFQSIPEVYQCIDPGTGLYITVRVEELEKYSNKIYSKI